MKFLTVLFVFVTFFSCTQESVPPGDVALGKDTELGYLKSVTIGNALKATFASFQESRCPKGVTCIRAGELFATLSIADIPSKTITKVVFCVSGECLSKKNRFDLSYSFSGDNIKVGNDGYKVFIKEYTPLEATQGSNPAEYSLKISVTK